jgi:FkbM family methyltransferase
MEDIHRKLDQLQATVDLLSQRLERLSIYLHAAPGVRTLPVEEHVGLVRLATGQRLYVDTRDVGVASNVMSTGFWERHYTHVVRRLVQRGQVCLDIGANFGYYTVFMGALVGPDGTIWSFEPNPHVYPLLVRSLLANGLLASGVVRPQEVALGAAAGTATLHFKMGDFGGGSLYTSAAAVRQGRMSAVEVKVRALDSYDIDLSRPVFMKIDAEGGELNILRGARKVLEGAERLTLMMEFVPAYIARQIPVAEYIGFLRGLGLRIHLLDGVRLVPVEDEALAARGNCYVFLSKQDLAEE